MRLIINADDFGYSKGVNLGIIEAYKNGLVRSATIMPGMAGFDHAVRLIRENPGLGVGVHLTLTAGKSVGGVYSTITDENGSFLSLAALTEKLRELDLSEVEREYEAQIQKVLGVGVEFDHIDSHHHTHTFEGIFDVAKKLALKYGAGMRVYTREGLTGEYAGIKTPEAFSDGFYGDSATAGHLKEIIAQSKAESLEIMCHPAYVDYALYRGSSYHVQRTAELAVLTGGALSDYLAENGAELCSYGDL